MVHSVAMSARARNPRVSPMTVISSRLRTHQPLPKSVRLSQLGKMRECEQVAAVCYRIRRGAIEFLLNPNPRRWTPGYFPRAARSRDSPTLRRPRLKQLKKPEFTAESKKPRSPAMSAAGKTTGAMLEDQPQRPLWSALTSVRFDGSAHRKSRIEIAPGFPLRIRPSACMKVGRPKMPRSSFA